MTRILYILNHWAEVPKKEPELIISTDKFCNLLYIQYTMKLDYNNTKGIRKNKQINKQSYKWWEKKLI